MFAIFLISSENAFALHLIILFTSTYSCFSEMREEVEADWVKNILILIFLHWKKKTKKTKINDIRWKNLKLKRRKLKRKWFCTFSFFLIYEFYWNKNQKNVIYFLYFFFFLLKYWKFNASSIFCFSFFFIQSMCNQNIQLKIHFNNFFSFFFFASEIRRNALSKKIHYKIWIQISEKNKNQKYR